MAQTKQHKGPHRQRIRTSYVSTARKWKSRTKTPRRCNLAKCSWCWTVGVLTSHTHQNTNTYHQKLRLGGMGKTQQNLSRNYSGFFSPFRNKLLQLKKNTLSFGYRTAGPATLVLHILYYLKVPIML